MVTFTEREDLNAGNLLIVQVDPLDLEEFDPWLRNHHGLASGGASGGIMGQ